jgi:hypothetical protein
MPGIATPRVFVSYARSDGGEFARKLRKRLEKARIPLWQDRVGMEGGRDWSCLEPSIHQQAGEKCPEPRRFGLVAQFSPQRNVSSPPVS